jgi:hypothetical protein
VTSVATERNTFNISKLVKLTNMPSDIHETVAFLSAATADQIVQWNKGWKLGIGDATAKNLVAHREKVGGSFTGMFGAQGVCGAKGIPKGGKVIEKLCKGDFDLPFGFEKKKNKGSPASVADETIFSSTDKSQGARRKLELGDSERLIAPLKEPLERYVRRDDGSHQRLGMTVKGMLLALERIKLISWKSSPGFEQSTAHVDNDGKEWRVDYDPLMLNLDSITEYLSGEVFISPLNYSRAKLNHKKMGWADEAYTPLTAVEHMNQRPGEEWEEFFKRMSAKMTDEEQAKREQDREEALANEEQREDSFRSWLESNRYAHYTNEIGYDVQAYIEEWMHDNHHRDKSLCEVVLTDPAFKDLRDEVGVANVFCSHAQKTPPWQDLHQLSRALHSRMELSLGEEGALSDVFDDSVSEEERRHQIDQRVSELQDRLAAANVGQYFVWLDYTSLRQAIKGSTKPEGGVRTTGDFHPDAVVELIGEIKDMVVLLDKEHSATHRTFCVLEMYAAAKHQMDIFVQCETCATTKRALIGDPIDSAHATTGDPEDAELIRKYIRTLNPDNPESGFGELNMKVTEAILQSLGRDYSSGADPFDLDLQVRNNMKRHGIAEEPQGTKETQMAYTTGTGGLYHLDRDCAGNRGHVVAVELWYLKLHGDIAAHSSSVRVKKCVRKPCSKCAV